MSDKARRRGFILGLLLALFGAAMMSISPEVMPREWQTRWGIPAVTTQGTSDEMAHVAIQRQIWVGRNGQSAAEPQFGQPALRREAAWADARVDARAEYRSCMGAIAVLGLVLALLCIPRRILVQEVIERGLKISGLDEMNEKIREGAAIRATADQNPPAPEITPAATEEPVPAMMRDIPVPSNTPEVIVLQGGPVPTEQTFSMKGDTNGADNPIRQEPAFGSVAANRSGPPARPVGNEWVNPLPHTRSATPASQPEKKSGSNVPMIVVPVPPEEEPEVSPKPEPPAPTAELVITVRGKEPKWEHTAEFSGTKVASATSAGIYVDLKEGEVRSVKPYIGFD